MINLNNVESESSLAYIEVPEVDEPQSAGRALQRQTEEGCWAECGVLRAVRLQEPVDDHEGLTDPLYDLVHLGVVLPALHLNCQELPPELSAQVPPNWLNVIGEENPSEVTLELEVGGGSG